MKRAFAETVLRNIENLEKRFFLGGGMGEKGGCYKENRGGMVKNRGVWGRKGFFIEKGGFRGFLVNKSGKSREEPGI